jgi:acetoin utilization deacetylase AcuC-like enzyme
MTVGIVYDPIYLKHDTGAHVENYGRLVSTMEVLEESRLLDKLTNLSPRASTFEEIALVHSSHHIARVESYSSRGGGWLDGDTVASPDSYTVALYAAGGVLRALDAVMNEEVNHAFALVRPPGHHATRDQAMGFCLFNNIAIAAKYAMANYNLERVLIADFDVHHGNGTEEIFYGDPNVLYFSTHQYPHYPGTGRISDDGSGKGKGTTVNVPLPAFCGDDEYHRVYREILVPVAERFKPQLILVSAGYDLHWADQLSAMQLTIHGFAGITDIIKGLADELCQGRLLFSLEGGYNLKALAFSIRACLEMLHGSPLSDDPLGNPHVGSSPRDIDSILGQVASTHGLG